MENNDNVSKLDQLSSWFSATVASAFFFSLERFACVQVVTIGDDDDDDEEAMDRPLTLPVRVSECQPSSNDVVELPV